MGGSRCTTSTRTSTRAKPRVRGVAECGAWHPSLSPDAETWWLRPSRSVRRSGLPRQPITHRRTQMASTEHVPAVAGYEHERAVDRMLQRPTRRSSMNHSRNGARVAIAAALAVAIGTAMPYGGAATNGEPPDVVLEWNANASNAIVTVGRQPPHAAILSFAMVQGAVYDAVNAIAGGYEPYL